MTKITKVDFAGLVEVIRARKGVVIDDHGIRGELRLAGVGLIDNGKRQQFVALCDSRYFSLNSVYLDEHGVPHLSTSSVGGVVMPMYHGGDLQEACDAYSAEQKENPFTSGLIVETVMFERDAVAA